MATPQRTSELASLSRDEDWLVSLRALDLLEKRARVIAMLRRDVDHPQELARAWALDGLAALAGDGGSTRRPVLQCAGDFERSGTKALAARARGIQARLAATRRSRPPRATGIATTAEPHLTVPSRGRGPGVLVLHPWWGLTSAVRGICDRLAKEGFVAIAPDLYGGRLARTAREARALRSARRAEPMWRTISRSLDILLSHEATLGSRVGVVGLSMGGHWALWFASRPESPIVAAVVFYAARAAAFARGPNAAFQFHLAEQDDFVSSTALTRTQRALRAAGRRCETWVYPGTRHWFFEPGRPEHDAKAAALAWTRMLAFLRKEMA